MTTKNDFDPDEWELLGTMPWIAGFLVVVSDPSWRVIGEIKAMAEAVAADQSDGPAGGLISELIRDTEADAPEPDDESSTEDMLEALQEGAALIGDRCSVQEAEHLRRWVLAVARATAEARREGGVLGIGAQRVSDKEHAALKQIESALNNTT